VQLYLIDGTYELFRSHYGAPPRAASGRAVGAARGLLLSLRALLNDANLSHVACAFDHVIESFRNELFEGYKTGEGIDPDLFSQFELAEHVSSALGMVTWPMVEFEADDALATAAFRFAAEPLSRIVLCSPDKDLCQCVRGERTVTMDRLRQKTLTEAGVQEKFGVPPLLIPDYLALVGDAADGIPGLAGWGPKSASQLLSSYGSIEAIPTDSRAWKINVRGSERLSRTLKDNLEAARLYRRLATLRQDVPLAESLEDLAWRGPRWPLLEALEVQLDLPGLVEQTRRLLGARLEQL
jgi:5'-3' exonuclease